jgi:glutamyl-tRNA reductase
MTIDGVEIHNIQIVRLRVIDLERRAGSADESGVPVSGVCAVFRTCVRDVVFLDEFTDARHPILEDGAAYARLIEIVCGLHSPMAGETQVQGQFKTFLDGLDGRTQQWLRRLGQQVLADARRIRDTHLQGLGSRTYGSAVRRHTQSCARVAIIGAGALAREIHDYVAEAHEVDVWTRARLQQLQLAPASTPVAVESTTLVVAAPVDADTITRVASVYPSLTQVIDLRAIDEVTPLPSGVPAHDLTDIFADAQASCAAVARISDARADAGHCGHRFDSREELHPFGWEDLCA